MRRPYIYLTVSIFSMLFMSGFWIGSVAFGVEKDQTAAVHLQAEYDDPPMLLASLEQPPEAPLLPTQHVTLAPPPPPPPVSKAKTSHKSTVAKTQPKPTSHAVIPAPAGVDGALWSAIRSGWRRDVSGCSSKREVFTAASELTGVPAALLAGIAVVESGCRSVRGGWMQLLMVGERTLNKSASTLGISRSSLAYQTDPLHAAVTGSVLLQFLENKEKTKLLALAAYNMGYGNLERITGGQTRNYTWLEPRLPKVTRTWLPGVLVSALKISQIWDDNHLLKTPSEADAARLQYLLGEE